MMIQKKVLAISALLVMLSFGSHGLKAAATPKACSTTYDVTWYDSSNAVISTTTTSDLATTVASPPTGATDYMWVDESNPSTSNYVTLLTPSTTALDFSDADTNTDPSQAIDVIYDSW
jgi:hypothetical protein